MGYRATRKGHPILFWFSLSSELAGSTAVVVGAMGGSHSKVISITSRCESRGAVLREACLPHVAREKERGCLRGA